MRHKLLLILIAIVSFVACKSPEARRPLKSSSGSFIEQSVDRNKKLYAKEESQIERLIAQESDNDFLASDTGFWYYYNIKDTTYGDKPEYGNLISFTYDVKQLDGNVILSEEENGLQQLKVDQTNQDLISGIRDGLKLMKEGETITFFFPSFKAYGYYGIQDKIGPNVPVKSKVTLKSIEKDK